MTALVQHLNTRCTLSSMPTFSFPSACHITLFFSFFFFIFFIFTKATDTSGEKMCILSVSVSPTLGRRERIHSLAAVLTFLALLLRLVARRVLILVFFGFELR